MKTKVKETVEQFLKDVTPYGRRDDFLQFIEGDSFLRWIIFTNDHRYSIVATFDKEPLETNYFGCTATTRKPRAGENHTRGNDLPDGELTQETWQRIKNAIIKYEVVNLSPALKYQPVGEEESIEMVEEESVV